MRNILYIFSTGENDLIALLPLDFLSESVWPIQPNILQVCFNSQYGEFSNRANIKNLTSFVEFLMFLVLDLVLLFPNDESRPLKEALEFRSDEKCA